MIWLECSDRDIPDFVVHLEIDIPIMGTKDREKAERFAMSKLANQLGEYRRTIRVSHSDRMRISLK